MNTRCSHAGFSLIELITVVLILGILAGVAAPKMMKQSEDAELEATIMQLKTIALACEMFHNQEGVWPPNGLGGVIPAGLEPYLRPNLFAKPCPLGGQYDWDNGNGGVAARIKIAGDVEIDRWRLVDQKVDDGDLSTGRLQSFLNAGHLRVGWTLEE